MSATYRCPVCGDNTEKDMISYIKHVKDEIIAEIRKEKPDWKEGDGICPKCKDHFDNWFEQLK